MLGDSSAIEKSVLAQEGFRGTASGANPECN